MARTIQTARKSPGRAATRQMHPARLEALPPRRPSRSPARVRKITNHGDVPPFVAPVPVAMATVATSRPIYLTQAQPPKADLFDHLQVLACILFVAIVTFALVGPSAISEASTFVWGPTTSPPVYVPFQQRGPLGWAWMLVKSANDW